MITSQQGHIGKVLSPFPFLEPYSGEMRNSGSSVPLSIRPIPFAGGLSGGRAGVGNRVDRRLAFFMLLVLG